MIPRIGIVHERFTEPGGSEKVVEALGDLWPDARLHAPVIDQTVSFGAVDKLTHSSTWLQNLYRNDGRYAHLLPLLPAAMQSIDLSPYDLVVLSHHAFANRVRIPEEVRTLSYVHTPARWFWDARLRAADAPGGIARVGLGVFAASQRRADRAAAARIDMLVANSSEVANRIRTWWGLDATVVHPPVNVDLFTPDPTVEREPFFLLAGRLVPYKRPEVAIAAAAEAGVRLVVAGTGRSEKACRAVAGKDIEFLGEVSDSELRDLFRRCSALVFPGIEDFGIVPVEAQACGAPVIGVRAGGLCDTVVSGRTGILVPESPDPSQVVASLAKAMRSGEVDSIDSDVCVRNASRFSQSRFAEEISSLASDLLE